MEARRINVDKYYYYIVWLKRFFPWLCNTEYGFVYNHCGVNVHVNCADISFKWSIKNSDYLFGTREMQAHQVSS